VQTVNPLPTVLALHGFLGQGADFERFKKNLDVTLIAPDLFKGNNFDLSSFESVAVQIVNQVANIKEPKIFVGYSLGGRIGLHILKFFPDVFDHYIFLSTHAGLNSEVEKTERKANDLAWSQKLKNLSWSDFLLAWNAQPVFAGGSEPQRLEIDFNRNQLENAFVHLSLGQQQNMNDVLQKNKSKISWVVGDKDTKFVSLAQDLQQKKILESYSRIFSGHRIVFDADPLELQKIIFNSL
jgi:2-succinyl-6-hydroxy-2,4-cyclohexadiene-1-carboxylate synthase